MALRHTACTLEVVLPTAPHKPYPLLSVRMGHVC